MEAIKSWNAVLLRMHACIWRVLVVVVFVVPSVLRCSVPSAGWLGFGARVAMGDQDPVILASYGSHRGGVHALQFRPHMKHVVSGGADSVVLLWSLHCRPNLRHPVVRPYRFLGHQVGLTFRISDNFSILKLDYSLMGWRSCWSSFRHSQKNSYDNICHQVAI